MVPLRVIFLLERLYPKPDYTIGRLSVRNNYICDTLEDSVRDLNKDGDLDDPGEGKIPEKTAIPYGLYELELSYSPKFRREMPLIKGVKHFTGIRIHGTKKGKVFTNLNTHGCVGVGRNKVPGGLIDSFETEQRITSIMRAYLKVGCKLLINII